MHLNLKDFAAGLFFIGVGLLYGTMAWTSVSIGSTLNMGPGYFPIVLAIVLIGLGTTIAVRSTVTVQQFPFGKVPWRGVILLSLATIVFAAFFEELGMFPGIFVTTLIASFASPKVRFTRAVLTSACIAVFCTLVFDYGVKLPVPPIGPLFQNLGI